MRHQTIHPNFSELRKRISTAFREARKKNIVAKSNFMCCGGCAANGMYLHVKKMPLADRKKLLGVAWYHNQDLDNLRRSGQTYIGFSGVTMGSKKYGNAKKCGKTLVECFKNAKLEVEWDGDTDHRILVKGLA